MPVYFLSQVLGILYLKEYFLLVTIFSSRGKQEGWRSSGEFLMAVACFHKLICNYLISNSETFLCHTVGFLGFFDWSAPLPPTLSPDLINLIKEMNPPKSEAWFSDGLVFVLCAPNSYAFLWEKKKKLEKKTLSECGGFYFVVGFLLGFFFSVTVVYAAC